MTVKEGIEKIRLMLASENEEVQVETSEESTQVTELSFETYDLKDGSKIDLSGLEIGAEAMLVDESGNTSPAPDGEHELVDGTMITIVDGKVEGIETPQAEAEPIEMPEEEIPMESDKFTEIDGTIENLKAENEALKAKIASIEGKFSQAINDLSDVVLGLASTPSAGPIQAPKNSFSQVEKREEKIERFLNKVKNLK
jgi:predicted RNase H-like nuclease (RuvC/YqgF family)